MHETIDATQQPHDTLRARVNDFLYANRISQAQMAKEIGLSKTAVSQFLNGVYKGNNDELAKKCEQFVKMGGLRQQVIKKPDLCLEVDNTKMILQDTRIAHFQNEILIIYGPAGCGKTSALKHYAAHNNGVIYVEANAVTRSPRCVLKLIAAAMGERPKGSTMDILEHIITELTGSNRLVIIDEAQHLTTQSFDTIRALNDVAGVGLVYAGNPDVDCGVFGLM